MSQHPRRGYHVPHPDSTTGDDREWLGRSFEGVDQTGRVVSTWEHAPWVSTTDSIGKHWNLLRSQLAEKNMTVAATFKSLRKTASSTVMASDVKDKELAVDMLLGHAPKKSWRHYVGFAPDFLHDAVGAIERHFLGS